MKNGFAHLSLALAMTLAGSSVVIGKVLTHQFPVFISQSISLLFAIAVLLPCAFLLEGNVFKNKISRRDLLFLFLQALTGMFLFRVFLLFGLKFTSAANSGIITSATPAILCVLSFIFLGERITKRILLGILLCFFGILLCFWGALTASASSAAAAPNSLLALGGNALVLLSVLCEALFTIFRKKNSFSNKPVTSTLLVILFAFFMFLLISLFELKSFRSESLAPLDLLPLIIYGVFCSALAYVLWFVGVAKVPVSIAASYTCMMPVSSLVLSYVFLGEALTAFHICGIAVCIGGIYVLSIYKSRKKEGPSIQPGSTQSSYQEV